MKHQNIVIGNKRIGNGEPVFIIAEIGVNHNGDMALAKKMVLAAKEAGADCVKFQTFQAEKLVTRRAPKAAYQLALTDPAESQFSMLKKLELSSQQHADIIKLCQTIDIIFLSTPYNLSDVDMLDHLGAPAFKLASIHLTELPTIEYVAKKNKPVLLSTGLGTLSDIKKAAEVFVATGNSNLVFFQCTTDYPARLGEANLRTIKTINEATGFFAGYSDNSNRIDTCVYAVASGAVLIEKHFTLDKSLPGPDHAASADYKEFSAMVKTIRNVEIALGSSEKIIMPNEARNAIQMKRSITAVVDIPDGMIITAEMVDFKRPATGLAPNFLSKIIGKRTARSIVADTALNPTDIIW